MCTPGNAGDLAIDFGIDDVLIVVSVGRHHDDNCGATGNEHPVDEPGHSRR
jgi:hypothetical protein